MLKQDGPAHFTSKMLGVTLNTSFCKAQEPKRPQHSLHRQSLTQPTRPRGNPRSLGRKPGLAGQHPQLASSWQSWHKTWYVYTGFHSKALAM